MPKLEVTDDQIIALVEQLSPERRRKALMALAAGAGQRRENRMRDAESQLRRACAERGLDWNKMSEDQREQFVDDLIHEDRSCER